MNDKEVLSRYVNKVNKFSRTLKEKENEILELSQALNANGEKYNEALDRINEFDKLTYAEFEEKYGNFQHGLEEDQESIDAAFDAYKKEKKAALENDKRDLGTHIIDEDIENEEKIDALTEEIRVMVEEQRRYVREVTKDLTARMETYNSIRNELYQELQAATTVDEKKRLSNEISRITKSVNEINLTLTDIKSYGSLINSIKKEYDNSELTYDAINIFADKFKDVEASLARIEDSINEVDFEMNIEFDATTNKYKVSCKYGNIQLSPAKEFDASELTEDNISKVMNGFASKVAENTSLKVSDIKNGDVVIRNDGKVVSKDKFVNAAKTAVATNMKQEVEQTNNLDTPTPEQTETEVLKPTTPEKPNTEVPETQTPEQPNVAGTETEEVEPENDDLGNDEPDLGQTPRTTPVNGTENLKDGEVYKVVAKKAAKKKTMERANLALVATAAIGLGFGMSPMILAGLSSFALGVEALTTIPPLIKYNATKHKLKRIARKFNLKVELGKEDGKCYFYHLDDNTYERVIINSANASELGDQIAEELQAALDKSFKNERRGKGESAETAKEYRVRNLPTITIDNLANAFVEFGGANYYRRSGTPSPEEAQRDYQNSNYVEEEVVDADIFDLDEIRNSVSEPQNEDVQEVSVQAPEIEHVDGEVIDEPVYADELITEVPMPEVAEEVIEPISTDNEIADMINEVSQDQNMAVPVPEEEQVDNVDSFMSGLNGAEEEVIRKYSDAELIEVHNRLKLANEQGEAAIGETLMNLLSSGAFEPTENDLNYLQQLDPNKEIFTDSLKDEILDSRKGKVL